MKESESQQAEQGISALNVLPEVATEEAPEPRIKVMQARVNGVKASKDPLLERTAIRARQVLCLLFAHAWIMRSVAISFKNLNGRLPIIHIWILSNPYNQL